eukprot:TRINITY_DN1739_c0_g1_i1.p1 TRINITY_DN1739_c0_g1~~TRINITY_DN1739_c0_g1_i1.p1  ORF type:complete len:278 (-),score=62.69 TRINITY_DN1739_c0_g1_i1:306-1139(-)
MSLSRMALKFDLKVAFEHLRKDAKLAVLVDKHHEEIQWPRESTYTPFHALVRAVIGQMLSVQAARTITERVLKIAPNLTPEAIHAIEDEELRKCGLSGTKVKSVKNLAARAVGGLLDFEQLETASDEEVIKALTANFGIGKWTAQMFLIFSMNRPDVYSPGDAGLRRAFKTLYGKDEIEMIIESWAPYRSIASLLLWRSLNNEPVEKKESTSETETKGKGKGKRKEKTVVEESESEKEEETKITIKETVKTEKGKKKVKVEVEVSEKSTRKTRATKK